MRQPGLVLLAAGAIAGSASAQANDDCFPGPESNEAKTLAIYADTVAEAVREREPHRVVFYLIELAGAFHRFYNQERVIGEDRELSEARLFLVRAAQRVLRHGLELVGIGAPETM